MKKHFRVGTFPVVLLLFVYTSISFAQQLTFESTDQLKPLRWLILQKLEGGEMFFVHSLDSVNGDKGTLVVKDLPYGEYAVQYDTEHLPGLRFILAGEDVHIKFDPEKPERPFVVKGEMNKVYCSFQRYNRKIIKKLRAFKRKYKEKPSGKLQKDYQNFRTGYDKHVDSLLNAHKGKLVWHFIKGKKEVLPDSLKDSRRAYIDYAVEHYFDEIDLNDTVLYNSHVLYDRLEEYLFKIPVGKYGKEKSQEYIKRLKNVFDKLTYMPSRASFVKTFMVLFSLEDAKATQYLEHLYEQLPETYRNNYFIEQLKGNTAPVRGQKFDVKFLERIAKTNIKPGKIHLIVFFSSDCPHCEAQLPVLYEYLEKQGYDGLQVTAVGLETHPEHWEKFTSQFKNWNNAYVSGPDISTVAMKYFVEYTPTYFVLDKNFGILEKTYETGDLYKILNYFFSDDRQKR
jgi:thiol-disulfide isomerase/thioredoxin